MQLDDIHAAQAQVKAWQHQLTGLNLHRREAEGRIRLAGCCIPTPMVEYECRHCGTDWDFREPSTIAGSFCPPEPPEKH